MIRALLGLPPVVGSPQSSDGLPSLFRPGTETVLVGEGGGWSAIPSGGLAHTEVSGT